MKMRKVISAFLVLICIFTATTLGTLSTSAEGTRVVYGTTSTSVKQGSTGYLYVYLDDLTDLSALNLSVYYDAEKITVKNVYNQVSSVVNDIATGNGSVNASYIFDGKGTAKKTNLFYIYYQVNSDAAIGDTYFDIVVTEAYDSALNEMNFSGSRCAFGVAEKTTSKSCSISSTSTISTSVGEEFELSYRLSSYQIASGSMNIQYDPELFEVVSVTNGGFLTGKIADVNTALDGAISISFVSTEYQYGYDIITVRFKTLKNVTETSDIKLVVTELYDLDLNLYSCNGYATNANIVFDESYTEGAPSMVTRAEYLEDEGRIKVTIDLEKNSHLGAGDFVLNFDPNVLTFASYEKGFNPSFFNVNTKKTGEGIIKFSTISLSDIIDAETVITIYFDVEDWCFDRSTSFTLSGSGLTDSMTNTIPLQFINASSAIYGKGHDETTIPAKAPTCTEPGWDEHFGCSRCGYGSYEKIPATGHHFGEWSVVFAPTCTDVGMERRDCNDCDHYETRDIAARGHSFVNTLCTVCGETRTALETWDISADGSGNLMASIYQNNVTGGYDLTITGSGDMKDYSSYGTTAAPWYSKYKSKISYIELPEGLTSVGKYAFYYCTALRQINIPDSVTKINDSAFAYSDKLVIIFEGEDMPAVPSYGWDTGCSYYLSPQKVILEEDATYVIDKDGNACLAKYIGAESEFVALKAVDGIPVTRIGQYAFYQKTNMKTYWIPENINYIDRYAFYSCNGLAILFGSDTLPAYLGYSWNNGSPYYLGATLWEAGDFRFVRDAFGTVALISYLGNAQEIIIPAISNGYSVHKIGDYAFYQSSLRSVVVSEGIQTIGAYAFGYCRSLETIQLPDSLNSIGNYAFQYCSLLKSIVIPEGVTSLYATFYDCTALESVSLPEGITRIDSMTFSGCTSLKELHLPDTVTYIGSSAFYNCTSLKILEIPASVHSISWSSVFGSTALDTLYIHSDKLAATLTSSVLSSAPFKALKTVVVPAGTGTEYLPSKYSYCETINRNGTEYDVYSLNAHTWSENVIVEYVECQIDGVIEYTCADCGVVKKVITPCHNMTQVDAKDPTCTEIGWYAYEACTRCDYSTCVEIHALGHRVIVPGKVWVDPISFENDANSPFALSDGVYASTNKTNNSDSYFTITALYDCTLNIFYSVSSETNYDKLIIRLNGNIVATISGLIDWTSQTLTLTTGDVVTVNYHKDSSAAKNEDTGWFKIEFDQVLIDTSIIIPAEEMEPTCTEDVVCDFCHEIVVPALGHTFVDRSCEVCGAAEPALETWDISADGSGNLMASIYQNKVNGGYDLIITGSGDMKNFSTYGTTVIPWHYEYSSKISYVELPEGLTSIGKYAFYYCTALRHISIPDSVTKIGSSAFAYSDKLVIAFEGDEMPTALSSAWNTGCSYYLSPQKVILEEDATYVIDKDGNSCLAKYIGSERDFVILEMVDGIPVTRIAQYAFYQTTNTKTCWIPAEINYIDKYAFDNCSGLTLLFEGDTLPAYLGSNWNGSSPYYLGASIWEDGNFRFVRDASGTVALISYFGDAQEIIIPATSNGYPVQKIEDYAFYESSLRSVVISEGIQTIGAYAFDTCSLETIQLPDSLTSIGNYAFQYCGLLKSIVIPEGVTSLYGTFNGCTALESVSLPEGITRIDSMTFSGCTSLKELHLPDTVTYIGSSAFYICTSLKILEIPALVHSMSWSYAFGATALDVLYIQSDKLAATLTSSVLASNPFIDLKTVVVPTGTATEYVKNKYPYCETINRDGTEYDVYSLNAHTWSENVIVEYVECQTDGVIEYTCAGCGVVKKVITPCHNIIDVASKDPTCTEIGWNAHEACTRCDYSTCVEIPALGHNEVIDEGKEPTELEPGISDGKHCDRCGEVLVAQETIPALGVNKNFKISSARLSLDSDINIVYLANVPAEYTDFYMIFTFNGKDYRVEPTLNDDGRYRFLFDKVIPQMVGDNIVATLYATNAYGEVVTNCISEYSVRKYCINQLGKSSDAKLKTMLSDLLVYAAQTQLYSGYKTDMLVTAGLEDIMTPSTFTSIDASVNKQQISGPVDSSVKWRSAGLVYENAMALYIKFAATDLDGLEVRITRNGLTQIVMANDFIVDADGLYKIYYRGIHFSQFNDTVTATFYRNGEQIGETLTYSVNSYIYRNQDNSNAKLRDLLRATYVYGESAKAYKNK